MTARSAHVRDVDESSFATAVIERSRHVPVVVDFWAAWCGPCRMLGPTLERLAAEADGDWELAKVDTDHNQGLAARYRIQGIPAVKAFKDGQVVNEFTGALPEPQVRAWLKQIVPSAADRLAAQGAAAAERGDRAAAESAFRSALAQDSRHAGAALGLAELLMEGGDVAGARRLLEAHSADPEAQRLLSRLRFMSAGIRPDFAALKARVEANPRDVPAQYELGMALAADEAYTAALDHLLEAVRIDRKAGDPARRAMLDLFTMLGEDDPRTREYRNRLSSVLF